MTAENPFHIKLGRIYAPNGTDKFVSFANRIRRAAAKSPRSSSRVRQAPTITQQYFSRRVIVKVNLVKRTKYGADAQRHHLDYIQRDSAARDGEEGKLYSRDDIFADRDDFQTRGKDDRHQFRVIVSPEDGKEMGGLQHYTRSLMRQMERDLETKLDWVAADHYDTEKPHTHIVIRGVKENGKTLIIPRQYIAHGMREAAEHIATRDLGPITQIDVAKKLALQVKQDRFTALDRDLSCRAQNNIVDLSKLPKDGAEWSHRLQKWRVKELSRMGLAEKIGLGKWRLDENFERTLRRLGERGDILKTYHRALSSVRIKRPSFTEPIYHPDEGAKL